MTQLFNGQTANAPSAEHRIRDGRARFDIEITTGAATIIIEVKTGWNTWVPVNGASYTESLSDIIDLAGPATVRFTLADAASVSVNAGFGE